jgi:hypothetical protein
MVWSEYAICVTRFKASYEGSGIGEQQAQMYLDAEVQNRLTRLANAKGIDFSALVNAMLRKDIELIEMAQ